MSYRSTYSDNEMDVWQGIHPLLSNYERITSAQYFSDKLDEISDKVVTAQLKSADTIVASMDYNANEISKYFSQSVESLNSTFEWGFAEVIWKLEQQQNSLKEIIKILQKPVETKARELRNRGFKAYQNGWYDDAITDLQLAIKDNRYDFTIHQTLGNIYLFHKKDLKNALDCYQKTAKYSEPYSKNVTSFAYLHQGLVYYLNEDYLNAYNSSSKAISLSPNISLCYYEHARYCANLNKTEEAFENLKKIVFQEPFYCVKIGYEPDFNRMSQEKKQLFENVFQRYKIISTKRLNESKELLDTATSLGIESNTCNYYSSLISKAEQSHAKSSILDFQQAIIQSEYVIDNQLICIENFLNEQIKSKKSFLTELPQSVKSNSSATLNKIILIFGGLIILWRIVLHVIDGIHLWGVAIGIIVGLIVGIIEGLIVALILCAILYFVLLAIFHIENNSSIKQQQETTNKTINNFDQELSKINEEHKKFTHTFTFPQPKKEVSEFSYNKQMRKRADFYNSDDDCPFEDE